VDYVSLLDVGVPVLNPIGNKSVMDSHLLTFTATASDPDNSGSLVFTLGAGFPTGASITTGGVFTWTPTQAQAGQVYQIKIIVTDNNLRP